MLYICKSYSKSLLYQCKQWNLVKRFIRQLTNWVFGTGHILIPPKFVANKNLKKDYNVTFNYRTLCSKIIHFANFKNCFELYNHIFERMLILAYDNHYYIALWCAENSVFQY